MKQTAAVIILLLQFLTLNAAIAQTRQLNLPAGDIYELRIHCGAGSLYLTSADWLDRIRVFAEIDGKDKNKIESQESVEKLVDLNLERKGPRAILKSELKTNLLNSMGILKSPLEARINLTVEVPTGIDLFIDDSSGPIHIQHYRGHLVIKDGSGGITLENVTGNVRVADGSGKIYMETIRGNVEIKDGSGGIELNKVRGDVRVTDGSGEISIQHVDGYVTVLDESGEININDISGNVMIRSSGSGEMNIERIKGQIVTNE